MKKNSFLFAMLFLIASAAFKSDNLPFTFSNRLERAGMVFSRTAGFVEVPIIKNGQMHYEFALKDSNKNFEIRYSIAPLDSVFIQFEKIKKAQQPGDIQLNPNQLYNGAFMATMANLAGNGKFPQMRSFGSKDVKSEFNADWGAVSNCEVSGEFGKGYKYCLAVALHKDNLADAYIFYLTDNPDYFQTSLQPVFYALKFK